MARAPLGSEPVCRGHRNGTLLQRVVTESNVSFIVTSRTMPAIRSPAVAGLFYPRERSELERAVADYLDQACGHHTGATVLPKALIAPHAGYMYSGPVAGTAFLELGDLRDRIRRVVLIGPSHHIAFDGHALAGATRFETPLGSVAVDQEAEASILELESVRVYPAAHAREHSLEVELPFLQRLLADFELVPIVVGDATAAEVADVLDRLWGGDETLIVVSSDLSHFLDYDEARRLDSETSRLIEAGSRTDLEPFRACGCRAINGLLWTAHRRGLSLATLDLRNSGDTAGPKDRVVGYGAYLLPREETPMETTP